MALDLAAQRLAVLQELTAALARTRTYDELASVIIDEALPALRAEVGVVALVSEDGRMLRNVGFKGVDDATEDAWRDYPVEAPVPVAEAALRRERIIVRTIAERNARYPVLAQVHGLEHGGPVTTFPLVVDERLLGVLGFCWAEPRELEAEDLTFLQTLADQCGLAIERARLYDVARREQEKLREMNERKDEFLAMLAHELRNPLAPIRAATDLLANVADAEPRVAHLQAVLARQTGHLTRIVDDLLDVSRITRGRLELDLEDIDLAALVRDTVSDHAPSFAAERVRLVVEGGDSPLPVRADRTRLAQAIANVLLNAMKFGRTDGKVTVRIGREGANAAVAITDDGIGIDPSTMVRLFEPFAQADQSLARSRGGLGLGLALVKGVVALHGGTVTSSSDGLGKGSTFRITLPLASTTTAPEARSPVTNGAPARKRVLIVEDNVDAAEMLGELVDSLGHEVRLAHRADEALAMLREYRAHVILSDIGLPDIDGFAFARQVRAAEAAAPATFLVAVSGYGTERDKSRARDAGFDAHLTKPIDLKALERLLR